MKRRFRVRRILHGYSEKIVEAESEEQAVELADCIARDPEQVMSTLSSDGIAGGFDVDVDEVGEDEELTELTEDDRRWQAQYLQWEQQQRQGTQVEGV